MPTKKTEEEQTEQTVAEEKKEPLSFGQKIVHIQRVLKAPKSRHNDFGNYDYRSLEDIFEALKPYLEEYHLLLTLQDGIELVGDRYYIKATATLMDSDNLALKISNTSYAREVLEKKKSDVAQVTGAASSYARKYALNGLFLIDDTKDADTNEYTKQTAEAPQRITSTEAKALEKMLSDNQRNWVLSHCKVQSLSELTQSQYTQVINGLKRNESKNQSENQ